ncbi:MAG: hypothetical protein JWN34_5315 [Bryobacterales bacterium]|nr:hypothetical protein [Bryobacterales bacterium]
MPTSISAGFQTFRSNLEITDLQAPVVATRQKRVREAIESGFEVLDSFLTGSYARDTLIAPLKKADVDLFTVLSSRYYQNQTPQGLLDQVREHLRQTYPTTPRVSKNGQAVTITFADFMVDVVPAFNRQGGGYLIPNASSGKWISTDPKRHIELWSEANEFHQGDLIPLIKMLKAWNRAHSERLRSFHLEAIAVKLLANVTITDFPSGLRYFFAQAQEATAYQLADPAGYGGDVGAYMTGTLLTDANQGLLRAEEWALEAEAAIADDRIDLAFDKYRMLFGGYFPAYG